jgi:hypothetical protein
MANNHGGARRPRGMDPRTIQKVQRLDKLFALEPDIPRKEVARSIGWDITAYTRAKAKMRKQSQRREESVSIHTEESK